VLLALEEVENAMVAFEQESNRRFILDKSVAAAQKSADLVRTLYITGLTDFQRLLDMERDLFQQQDLLAASQGSVSQNLVRLYKALGGGWNSQLDPVDFCFDDALIENQQTQQSYTSIGGWNDLPDQTQSQDTTLGEEQQ